jgi:hypothetical protein
MLMCERLSHILALRDMKAERTEFEVTDLRVDCNKWKDSTTYSF